MHILRAREEHRACNQMVPGDLVDEPEHLAADLAVARMPLRRRAQLDEMHGLARVQLDHVAHPVTERDEVAGLLRKGVDDLAVGGFRLANGNVPSLSETGVDDRVGNLVSQRRRQLLPLHGEHAVTLQIAERPVIGHHLERVVAVLEPAPRTVAAVASMPDSSRKECRLA